MKRVPRAVVDTNVLVAAVIRPTGVCAHVLAGAANHRWQPVVSALPLAALAEVLHRPKFRRWLTTGEADAFVGAVGALAEFADDPASGAPGATRDSDDDYRVALARAAGVDALVSGDGAVAASLLHDLLCLFSNNTAVLGGDAIWRPPAASPPPDVDFAPHPGQRQVRVPLGWQETQTQRPISSWARDSRCAPSTTCDRLRW